MVSLWCYCVGLVLFCFHCGLSAAAADGCIPGDFFDVLLLCLFLLLSVVFVRLCCFVVR